MERLGIRLRGVAGSVVVAWRKRVQVWSCVRPVGDGCWGGVLGGWCRIERSSFGVWHHPPPIHEFTNSRISRIHESHPPRIQPLGDGCVCPPVVQLSSLLLLSSSLSSSLLASSKQQAIDARCPRLNPYPPPSSDCLGCSGWLLAADC